MKIYGVPGSNIQHIGKKPDNGILMQELRPPDNHVCQDNGDGTGTWISDIAANYEEDRIKAVKTEQENSGIKNITVQDAKSIIDARMAFATDFESLKEQCTWIFKKMIVHLLN